MRKISYSHPEFDRIKREVEQMFDSNFNMIQIGLLEGYHAGKDEYIIEYIIDPSVPIQTDYWLDNYVDRKEKVKEYTDTLESDECFEEGDFYEYLEENYYNEIQDAWAEHEHYPMWSTVFEAKGNYMNEWLQKHIDELFNIGIGVIGEDPEGNHRECMFISGAGYDFFEAHWIPLFTELLNWVKVESEEEK